MTRNEKKVTAMVDEELFKKFKVQVVIEGSTIKETLELLISNYLLEKGAIKPFDHSNKEPED